MRRPRRTLGGAVALLMILGAASVAGVASAVPEAPEAPVFLAPPESSESPALPVSCAPPCGYIVPLISMDFPGKPPCGGGFLLGDDRPTDCLAMMEDGGSLSLQGVVRWHWEVSEEGHYPNDAQEDIVLSFGSTRTKPAYIDIRVEPAEFVLDTVVLFDPQHYRQEEGQGGVPRLFYSYEQPIEVTFSRAGGPEGPDLERMVNSDGIVGVFLKAHSTKSGERFKESFGIEEFRFDAYEDEALAGLAEAGRGAPGPSLLLVAAALSVAAVALRRRP